MRILIKLRNFLFCCYHKAITSTSIYLEDSFTYLKEMILNEEKSFID